MANDKKNKATAVSAEDAEMDPLGAIGAPSGDVAFDQDELDGLETVSLDRELYTPQLTKVPLRGYLIGTAQYPSKQAKPGDKAFFDVLIFHTVRETETAKNKREVKKTPAGSTVMAVATAQLRQFLPYANMAACPLMSIEFVAKDDLPDGRQKNRYAVKFQQDPKRWKPREEIGGLINAEYAEKMLAAASNGAAAALPAASADAPAAE